MKYTPDHKYDKSKALIGYLLENQELPRSMRNILEDEMIDLLVYNILKKEEHIKLQGERLREYQSVFDAMSKFITSKGPTVYK